MKLTVIIVVSVLSWLNPFASDDRPDWFPASCHYGMLTENAQQPAFITRQRKLNSVRLRDSVTRLLESPSHRDQEFKFKDDFVAFLEDAEPLHPDAHRFLAGRYHSGAATANGLEKALKSPVVAAYFDLSPSERKSLIRHVQATQRSFELDCEESIQQLHQQLLGVLDQQQVAALDDSLDTFGNDRPLRAQTLAWLTWMEIVVSDSKPESVSNVDNDSGATTLCRLLVDERIGTLSEFGDFELHDNPFQDAYAVGNFVLQLPASIVGKDQKKAFLDQVNLINDKTVAQAKHIGSLVDVLGREDLVKRKNVQDAFHKTRLSAHGRLSTLMDETFSEQQLKKLEMASVNRVARNRGLAYALLRCPSLRLDQDQKKEVRMLVKQSLEQLEQNLSSTKAKLTSPCDQLDALSQEQFSNWVEQAHSDSLFLMMVKR